MSCIFFGMKDLTPHVCLLVINLGVLVVFMIERIKKPCSLNLCSSPSPWHKGFILAWWLLCFESYCWIIHDLYLSYFVILLCESIIALRQTPLMNFLLPYCFVVHKSAWYENIPQWEGQGPHFIMYGRTLLEQRISGTGVANTGYFLLDCAWNHPQHLSTI